MNPKEKPNSPVFNIIYRLEFFVTPDTGCIVQDRNDALVIQFFMGVESKMFVVLYSRYNFS